MPAPHPPEFRRKAFDLARQAGTSVAKVAQESGCETGLRRWMAQDDVDTGRKEGLSSNEREELVRLRREDRRLETELEITSGQQHCSRRRTCSQRRYRLVRDLATNGFRCRGVLPGAEGLEVGYYGWARRPPSERDLIDACRANTIVEIGDAHASPTAPPRVYAELRLGMGIKGWTASASRG